MSASIPVPDGPFAGAISELATDSTPARPRIVAPPEGAPNVVVVMFDDVGFGAASTFGGPTPPRRSTGSRRRACATTSSTPQRSAHPPGLRC